MSDQTTILALADQRLAALSSWIDEHNADRDAEARTWGRVAKLAEETGEVVAAYIGVTGQNPREGASGYPPLALVEELYDVAITALGAITHLHKNRQDLDVTTRLLERIAEVHERAGLPEIKAPKVDRPKATHRVTWDEHGLPTWHCDGDVLSGCHWYPDCECESWGSHHAHPYTPHERCWLLDWLENTWQDSHIGPDGDAVEHESDIPRRDGLIDWEYDEGVLWSYADESSPEGQVATFLAVADGVTALVHGDEELTDEDREALGVVLQAAAQEFARTSADSRLQALDDAEVADRA